MSGPTKRPGRVSPPHPGIAAAIGETLPGAPVLDEMRTPLGTTLWQLCRDAMLWASTPGERRALLFAGGAAGRMRRAVAATAADPALRKLLDGLVEALHGGGSSSPQAVAAPCHGVAGWAERNGLLLRIALAFAQAAALAAPADADYTAATGLLALRLGQHARGESWLRRTVAVARRSAQSRPAVVANVALGRLYLDRGDPVSARRFFLLALRRARRYGVADQKGPALHALFDVSRLAPRPGEDPDAYARSALLWYRDPAGAATLLRAWARWCLTRVPRASLLAPEDDPRLPSRGTSATRAQRLAIIAEEAAGLGAEDEFDRAWTAGGGTLTRWVHQAPRPDPGVVLALARAAAKLGRDGLAAQLTDRVADLARSAGDAGLEREARAVLESRGDP